VGIEKEVAERISILEEQKIEHITHVARFAIKDEMPREADDDPDVVAGGENTEDHVYVAEGITTRYKVTYIPITTYDAQGAVVKTLDKLTIEYDTPIMMYARTIFKPVELNGTRFVPAPTIKIEDGKIIEPYGRKHIHMGELDELVVKALKTIASPPIQEALGTYIAAYAQTRTGNG
jgi:hypothetical protein